MKNVTDQLGTKIPNYEPSEVIHEWLGGRILSTSDPVLKVGEFYVDVADKSGWTVLLKVITPQSSNLVVKEFPWGASISIHPHLDSTHILISTYPWLW